MRNLLFAFIALLLFAASTYSQNDIVYPTFPVKRKVSTQTQTAITEQYRKPNKRELETLAVSLADKERFASFLRQPKTGLIKLVANSKCSVNTKVLVATPDCLKYSMPGAGSSYSFRTENYRNSRLADLTFSGNSFALTGELINGILLRLGDVPLENVSLQTTGLNYLTEFKPRTNNQEVDRINNDLVKGVTKDGYFYRRNLNADINTTYVLRVVAYNGRLNYVVQGIVYNEFDFDKRKDVIVAFRVINRDAESVIILWKKLAEKDAPKLIQ